MLAARDQENRIFSHPGGAGAKGLQPKTPGARYPKTPLKVPLNDENAAQGPGKSVLGAKLGGGNENVMTIGKAAGAGLAGKANWVTPLEPRTSRAPLGNKTTNAKARAAQTVGVKDVVGEMEKSQARPTTVQRPRARSPKAEGARLDVLSDQKDPLGDEEEEVEYCPPRPKDLPYESDIIPPGALTTASLKRENLFRGYHDYYHRAVDENGMTRLEREAERQKQAAFRKAEDRIQKDLDEFVWDLDLEETGPRPAKTKLAVLATSDHASGLAGRKASRVAPRQGPATIASRRAASALAMAPRATANAPARAARPPAGHHRSASSFLPGRRPAAQKVPVARDPLSSEGAAALAASRSTLGYTKGRSASSVVHGRAAPEAGGGKRTLARSLSTASSGSDTTITPARYAAKGQARGQAEDDGGALGRLEFLSIFDIDEDDDGHLGASPDHVDGGLDDDDFELKVDF